MQKSPNLLSINRWWIYQKERFPIVLNGLLIAAFSFAAVAYSAALRSSFPQFISISIAFCVSFLFFLQLRIADEFKDYEDDRRFRPYRPVPRGLVSLRELGWLGVLSGLIQIGLSLFLNPNLGAFLVLTWLYFGLMSQEFFVRDWLKAHPIIYMLSHIVIMPLIGLYATACDWFLVDKTLPLEIGGFLGVSYFNGLILEIGRKIRAPKDEEVGVETYSYLWGRRRAVFAWLSLCSATTVLGLIAATVINCLVPVGLVLVSLLIASSAMAVRFLQYPISQNGKRLEMISALWTLLVYLSLGVAAVLFHGNSVG